MGQAMSDEPPRQQSREELTKRLAVTFKDKCFSSLEFYLLKAAFESLADRQGNVRYLKEDSVARFLEIPDIIGAAPVIFQMISYIGAFPFLHDAPAVLELPQLIIVLVIMTERYRKVLARGASDRNRLFFKALAVHDKKVAETGSSADEAAKQASSSNAGFGIDQAANDDDDEDDEDLVLTAFELLDIDDAFKQGDPPPSHGAMIPPDNFRKILMLLLLAAPMAGDERLSQYSDHASGESLEALRATAESILAAFVDVETSPGIRYSRFKSVVPTLLPNLFRGFNGIFEHFLFAQDLGLSKHKGDEEKPEPAKAVQPLLPQVGEILNEHSLAQLSFFIPGDSLFRRVRPLYSGNEAGFSMGSFETKVFNWRAPTLVLVRGTRISSVPDGGRESAFADMLPPKRFPDGSKSDRLTFGVYIREPWKHTHRECFGDSDTVLFQLEPVHDVFAASTLNTDYVTFTKPPANDPCLSFGGAHPHPTKSGRRNGVLPMGSVSLTLDGSFEFGVFNHDFTSRGGAFQTSSIRQFNFQDRFQVESLEVWGCGGDKEAKAQADRWAWEAKEAEARRKINLGSGDIEADRALLEMAGLVGGGNRSGGSMA
ncbi:Meiotically up-regulated glycoproteins C-terminal [Geosmithia morbida]|uniref:Restriction of telomere capping protein 5 n=1 Tax=Geosmithia morbida TaxID=1094350 RepID=A0A9P5D3G6_9HYPO|nr:Meiotically up-regulated glycoproteins C-terminal [Geosmithia morbida]KAF4124922.1 Meiotically up-regulated glycoproteins C-terminal [Geosmithia morbida]